MKGSKRGCPHLVSKRPGKRPSIRIPNTAKEERVERAGGRTKSYSSQDTHPLFISPFHHHLHHHHHHPAAAAPQPTSKSSSSSSVPHAPEYPQRIGYHPRSQQTERTRRHGFEIEEKFPAPCMCRVIQGGLTSACATVSLGPGRNKKSRWLLAARARHACRKENPGNHADHEPPPSPVLPPPPAVSPRASQPASPTRLCQ